METKGEKFCRTLEQLMKCSICLERLNGDIVLCEAGHSVCRGCLSRNGLQRCISGTCRKPYTTTQNVLAQELLLQLDGIKVCLMELDAANLKSKFGKNADQSAKDELLPGQYRCWIMNDCKFIGYSSKMYDHCKNIHPLEFDEHPQATLPYTQNWQMNYSSGNNLNRAFNIPNTGLFILHISKTEHEEMRACIFMCAPSGIAFQYSYKIEVECDEKKLSYNGQVDSARIPKNIVLRSGCKGLLINRNEPLFHALRGKLRFKCSIAIEKTSQNDTDEANINNMTNQEKQQGRNYGNRRGNINNNKGANKQHSYNGNTNNNGQKNQSRSNNVPHKHQIVGSKYKINEPQNESINVISFPRTDVPNTEKSNGNNQLSHSKSLYPNLGASDVTQTPQFNIPPIPTRHEMIYQRNANVYESSSRIDNHFDNTHASGASAPYERPPPLNPYFEGQKESNKKNTYHKKTTVQKNQEEDKCILS